MIGRPQRSRLEFRIFQLERKHGSLRAAARFLKVDAGYLSRLKSGQKNDPSDDLLERMGLCRVVTYKDLP